MIIKDKTIKKNLLAYRIVRKRMRPTPFQFDLTKQIKRIMLSLNSEQWNWDR
jgi:hypothetical protein